MINETIIFVVFAILPGCNEGCQLCFYLENQSCRLSPNDLANAKLGLTFYEYGLDANGFKYIIPIHEGLYDCQITTERKIGGDEVNFGFWSKNSYHEHTWEEMFVWKYKREPTTAEDFALLTEENVKQWFKDRYTSKNVFGKEKPKNVKTFDKIVSQNCTTFTKNSTISYGGKIIFADGSYCELETVDPYVLGSGECPSKIAMRVKKGCSKCY